MARFPVRLGLLALTLSILAPATTVAAGTQLQGIDVSEFQETIDWPTVAENGITFAIIRATKGSDYVDPMYATNRSGAASAGIAIGAYHRATVSLDAGDALAEANFFVKKARNAGGDVIPALDIEQDGGLTDPQLIDWVKTWVQRVRDRLGVRPMIYTSPNFWRTYLADTTWFADHGYPLWIANWNVPEPQQIAGNWSGQGYTYWQYTVGDFGSLPGITTKIDRDVFAGADLLDGTIASLTVTPASGGTITGPRIACGGGLTTCERRANPNEVITLTATPDDLDGFQGWTGACAAMGASPTCDVTLRGAVGVSAVFRPAVVLSEDGEGSAFDWGVQQDVRAAGGSYRWERRANASLSFAFKGSKVKLQTIAGPRMGKATIRIDTVKVGTIDGWAASFDTVRTTYAGLAPGPHVLRVTATGTNRARSHGTRFGVDALRWGGEDRDDPLPISGTWGPWDVAAASDGTARVSDITGASASLAFTGTGVTWVGATGPRMGQAEIWVDGVLVRTVDLYAATRTLGAEQTVLGLTDTPHELRVVVLGTANETSRGHDVVVDGWIVR